MLDTRYAKRPKLE